ncbi:MAG: flavin reductase family protein [Planctomycetota bacterium]|nr:flavin reductase family protein [Planctomycetota bacterium]
MTMQKQKIDKIFKMTNRELWIVTAGTHQRRGGLLATWVLQASLDRECPVLVAGIAPNHFTRELIDDTGAFATHLLHQGQVDLALNFALHSGRNVDKLAGLRVSETETGNPVLQDALCWLDCRVFARLDTGDRIFYWADVIAGEQQENSPPLTEQELLKHIDDNTRKQLILDRESDIEQQNPQYNEWRQNLPSLLRPV